MTRHGQPFAERGRVARQAAGQAEQQAGERDRADQGDHGEGRAPAEQAADEIAEGNADDGRDREARGDQRHRAAAPFRRGDGHGDGQRRRHAQSGAQRHQHARGQQQGVSWMRPSPARLPAMKVRERQRQHGAAVDIVQRHRQDRRADGIGEGVGGDQLAGGRDRNRRSLAIDGKSPAMTKPSVPIAKAARASQNTLIASNPYVQCLLNYRRWRSADVNWFKNY